MISLICRWITRTRPLPPEIDRTFAGEEIASCKRCGELLRVRYTLRFMTHLQDDHKMNEDDAIETAIKISETIYKQRRKK